MLVYGVYVCVGRGGEGGCQSLIVVDLQWPLIDWSTKQPV